MERCKMRESIEMKEYSIEEFEKLSEKKEESGKYIEVWKVLEKKLKGKSVNNKYLKNEFLKECKKLNVEINKYVDSILYGKMERLRKKEKVEKKFDGNVVVWKFI